MVGVPVAADRVTCVAAALLWGFLPYGRAPWVSCPGVGHGGSSRGVDVLARAQQPQNPRLVWDVGLEHFPGVQPTDLNRSH